MVLPARLHHYRYTEYLALEEHSPVRHEWVEGEIYAMAGGTPEHAALAAMLIRLVGNQLPSGCRAYSSDLRVRITAFDMSTYPDAAVICGAVVRAADDSMAVTNPTIIVEVTSDSTEAYDRGAKAQAYMALPSLQELVIVSHRERLVEVHRRHDDGSWSRREARSGESVPLESIGGTLSVDQIFVA